MEKATHISCPYCLGTEAFARGVKVSGEDRTYTFKCTDCGRSWQGETQKVDSKRTIFGTLEIRNPLHRGDA